MSYNLRSAKAHAPPAPKPARKKRASSPAPAADSAAAAPAYTHTYQGESEGPSLLTSLTAPITRTISALLRTFSGGAEDGAESVEAGGAAAAPTTALRSDSTASSSWTFTTAPPAAAAASAVPRSDSAESLWPFTTEAAVPRSNSAESWWPFTTATVESGDGAAASSNFFGGLLRTFSMGEPSALGPTASGELPGDSAPTAAAPAPMLGRLPSALSWDELWRTPSAASEAVPL